MQQQEVASRAADEPWWHGCAAPGLMRPSATWTVAAPVPRGKRIAHGRSHRRAGSSTLRREAAEASHGQAELRRDRAEIAGSRLAGTSAREDPAARRRSRPATRPRRPAGGKPPSTASQPESPPREPRLDERIEPRPDHAGGRSRGDHRAPQPGALDAPPPARQPDDGALHSGADADPGRDGPDVRERWVSGAAHRSAWWAGTGSRRVAVEPP